MDQLSKWFRVFKPVDAPVCRLICFPYAGGGASVFRNWAPFLPDYVELLVLQLPGRENRISETCCVNMMEAVHSFDQVLSSKLDLPVFFFGHSMGAMIAYEYARFIRLNHHIEPAWLFLSGRSGPEEPRRGIDLNRLNDNELIKEVTDNLGASKMLLESSQLAELFIKTMRADLTMMDTYQYIPDEPLSCPITVLSGQSDMSFHSEELLKWRYQTSGNFSTHYYAGGHLYLNTNTEALVNTLSSCIQLFAFKGGQ
ncbi:alpha/beta fold hydrolase [Paenibacillus polysaccharolyticus]|uniref:thioesterase II family protein n=1 Tax=Paenibacillus polysaccharolyticus TaxID=582692 RepID=UPI002041E755|nr:alpha/beta fold hydrolase [Paenibacillus polysaccharolyticus]MCM3132892.1 alpha/beta fold hydrolase [Paenibacillus polysaccharolyticus]